MNKLNFQWIPWKKNKAGRYYDRRNGRFLPKEVVERQLRVSRAGTEKREKIKKGIIKKEGLTKKNQKLKYKNYYAHCTPDKEVKVPVGRFQKTSETIPIRRMDGRVEKVPRYKDMKTGEKLTPLDSIMYLTDKRVTIKFRNGKYEKTIQTFLKNNPDKTRAEIEDKIRAYELAYIRYGGQINWDKFFYEGKDPLEPDRWY